MNKNYNTAKFEGYNFGTQIIDAIMYDNLFNQYIDDIFDNEITISKEDNGEELHLNQFSLTDNDAIKIAKHIIDLDDIQDEFKKYELKFSSPNYGNDFIDGLADKIVSISESIISERFENMDINDYKQYILDCTYDV